MKRIPLGLAREQIILAQVKITVEAVRGDQIDDQAVREGHLAIATAKLGLLRLQDNEQT